MTVMRRSKRLLGGTTGIVGLMIASILVFAPAASATHAADAPAGYGGPVSSCGGTLVSTWVLESSTYDEQGSFLEIFYSGAAGGTFCAMVQDYLPGSHYMSVTVRRGDWVTPWYDTGTYNDYAGGIQVFGAAGRCVYFYGLVTVSGVKYEFRIGLTGSSSPEVCWAP
jgi:hypothetical protein